MNITTRWTSTRRTRIQPKIIRQKTIRQKNRARNRRHAILAKFGDEDKISKTVTAQSVNEQIETQIAALGEAKSQMKQSEFRSNKVYGEGKTGRENKAENNHYERGR